eukprot:TRINITY_DN1905_c0_g2_i2.p1 TRINITY_DN1905_c0_g2~~TRINITY_DN1905_c0_g2_i2.p1  ORF type:complete len:182 (-),score=38.33 TRINITY_DN1905_c0_g2_i2:150-695(-)
MCIRDRYMGILINEPLMNDTKILTNLVEKAGESQPNESCFPTLTFKERFIGFGVCVLIGLLLELVSLGSFKEIIRGEPGRFAICYTLGNVLSLVGTSFLTGPVKQFKNMSDPKRLYTSLTYLGAMILTLVSALYLQKGLLVIIFVIVQFAAYVWYVLSYIPYGQECAKKVFKSAMSSENTA